MPWGVRRDSQTQNANPIICTQLLPVHRPGLLTPSDKSHCKHSLRLSKCSNRHRQLNWRCNYQKSRTPDSVWRKGFWARPRFGEFPHTVSNAASPSPECSRVSAAAGSCEGAAGARNRHLHGRGRQRAHGLGRIPRSASEARGGRLTSSCRAGRGAADKDRTARGAQ